MPPIQSLCVYCGSSTPKNTLHSDGAKRLGKILLENDITLVYGGARVGLMGMVADSVLEGGGTVIGVIPEHLQQYEVGHHGITKLHIVENMHVRKMMMFDHSDAFVALPGGYGTLDEMFEMLTWRQLKMHNKPLVLIDIDNYWQPLRTLLDHIVDNGYARPETRALLQIVESVEDVIPCILKMPHVEFKAGEKWV